MKLIVPPTDIAWYELRALKTVAVADGELHELESQMLVSIQTYILKTNFSIDELKLITPQELSCVLQTPIPSEDIVNKNFNQTSNQNFKQTFSQELCQQIIYHCILISIIAGKATKNKTSIVDRFAKALKVNNCAVKTLRYLTNHRLALVRINVFRHGYIGPKVMEILRNQGIGGMIPTLKYLMSKGDAKTAARYQQLAFYPEGTLGKEFYQHVRKNGFGLPGEEGGTPELIVVHDCAHILGEYDTSISEEVMISAFQAGFLDRDPFWGLFFTLLQLHLGIKVLTASFTVKNQVEPESFFQAFERGTHVKVNLFNNWNPWLVFERQVKDLRQEYNIPPRN